MLGKYLVAANLFILVIGPAIADICDLCVCEKSTCDGVTKTVDDNSPCSADVDDVYRCDGNHKVWRKFNQTIELDNIEWPNKNGTVAVSFNNLKLTYLTKVLCASRTSASPTLTRINLDHNFIESITTDPFQYCRHLRSVSIAHNLVSRLTKDFVKSADWLERLDVSHNMLTEFSGGILSNSKRLIALDVSHNQITTLKLNEISNASPMLESINAANNLLFVVNGDNHAKYLRLKYLNLSGNTLTVLTSTSFVPFPNLVHLDLSSNDLSNIEHDAFAALHDLRTLNLSHNVLADLTLNLTNSLEHLVIASNSLQYWPLAVHPQNLKTLELQHNRLAELFYSASGRKEFEFTNLIEMNVSRNRIEAIPLNLQYPALRVFDLSFNHFGEMPQALGRQAPNLDWLRMSGNHMKTIKFTQKVFARKVELSQMPRLTELDASQFDWIASKTGCVELTISHSPLLRSIQNSFEKVSKLCYLDLSYNALTAMSQNWANWSALDRGIDFQGNPISCTCVESQWLLDTFLPMMYQRRSQQRLLNELRCAAPPRFRNQRLIKYYQHDAIFCGKEEVSRAHIGLFQMTPTDDSGQRTTDLVSIAVIVALLVIIVILTTTIIVIWVRRRRERLANKNNRRFSNGGFL